MRNSASMLLVATYAMPLETLGCHVALGLYHDESKDAIAHIGAEEPLVKMRKGRECVEYMEKVQAER